METGEGEKKKQKSHEFVVKGAVDGKLRTVILLPNIERARFLLGEDPKERLAELIKTYSDSKIAEMFSSENIQVPTIAISHLRRKFFLPVNKNESPQRKFDSEKVKIAGEIARNNLYDMFSTRKQDLALTLSYGTSHRATPQEVQRVLGLSSLKEVAELENAALKSAKRILLKT